MKAKIPVRDIIIEDERVSLFLKDKISIVEYNQQEFVNLWLLVNSLHALSDPIYIKEFAEISNFFWKGLQFQCISSIPEYQKYYKDRVDLEIKYPADIFEYRLTDFKLFDVSVMHNPKIENDRLIYFVYNTQTGLPFRVTSPFPYHSSPSTFVHYQILPLLEGV